MNVKKYFEYAIRLTSSVTVKNPFKSKNNIFYVGKDKEYKTLKSGIEQATKYMNSVLCVSDGIYDLFEEFGAEYFAKLNKNSSNREGLLLKNRVHIIFSKDAKVIFNYKGENKYVKTKFSPFNTGDYGFILENVNIECSNCRYCVHDEMHSSLFSYYNNYINCRMVIDNTDNKAWKSAQCIGGGLGYKGNIVISNSCFYTKTPLYWSFGHAVTYHNRVGLLPTNCKIVINNCNFEKNNTFKFYSCGKHKDISHAILYNNNFGYEPGNVVDDGKIKNTEIIQNGNIIHSMQK